MKIFQFKIIFLSLFTVSVLSGQVLVVDYVPLPSMTTNTSVSFEVYVSKSNPEPMLITQITNALNFPAGAITGTIAPMYVEAPAFMGLNNPTPSIIQGTTYKIRLPQTPVAIGSSVAITDMPQLYGTVTVTSTMPITFPLVLTPSTVGNPSVGSAVYHNGATNTVAITLAGGGITTPDAAGQSFGAPLPIKISDLSAFTEGKKNVINWSTSSEYNNDVQIVEASNDGIVGWRTITKLKSKNSATGASYEAFDTKPSLLTYYRIRSIDFDGIEQYSDIVSVLREAIKTSRLRGISPIPSDGFITADIEFASDNDVTYRIIDVAGKELISTSTRMVEGNNNLRIDISRYPAGTYTLVVTGADLRASEQFIKQ